ncbi:hypothetical protein IM40_08130 [Candidatus Paracaedimonas acanthamoebae]|nr:hypothetical protein IM40_08130 [Candidatus Paracaedimonas acanthamoebae]
MRYFAVTIHYSRFVDAAKALNTSSENLKVHFFKLEKKLHQHLFLRHQGKRILELTPEGEALKRITQRLYNLED